MRGIFGLALCGACLGGCVSVNQGSRPMGSIIGRMETPPEPGDWCRVTYPEQKSGAGSSRSELTGKVIAVDDEGIHLSEVVANGRMQQATPVASRLPYFGRYFKNTGVGREAIGDCTVVPAEFERLDIISEEEGRQSAPPLVARNQNVAQQLVAAVPGRR